MCFAIPYTSSSEQALSIGGVRGLRNLSFFGPLDLPYLPPRGYLRVVLYPPRKYRKVVHFWVRFELCPSVWGKHIMQGQSLKNPAQKVGFGVRGGSDFKKNPATRFSPIR